AKTTPENIDNNADLKALLEKNLEIAQKNLEVSEGILICAKTVKSYLFWKKVTGIVVWVFIILSTAASIFYLPTLIGQVQSKVQSMSGGVTPGLLGF
ncbi:MAG: hypothetical protein WCJ57_04110, partial [Candidatus Falkowbacteria bacterium]